MERIYTLKRRLVDLRADIRDAERDGEDTSLLVEMLTDGELALDRLQTEAEQQARSGHPDWAARVIDELAGAGYEPADSYADLFTPSGHPRPFFRVVDHFADRGWNAVRVLSDTIQFARWSEDDGARLLSVTTSGSIITEARFSVDRHGLRMFTVAAELRP